MRYVKFMITKNVSQLELLSICETTILKGVVILLCSICIYLIKWQMWIYARLIYQ